MKESEILLFMLDSIRDDNYEMAKKSGMTEDQIKESFQQSHASIAFIVQNLYNRMKEQEIILPTL
jgi:hypothetical protein